AGIASMVYGLYRFSRELILPVLAHSKADKNLVQIVAEHRFGLSRPEVNVVAIGGGTGLATLLRGLKRHDVSITAIVTVADDGGSTGKIRSAYDIPAPGDIRNCLVALADDESLVSRLFQYRFTQVGSELDGHSLGNLFITALTKVTGSFDRAIIESATVLNIRGRVLPSTLENVRLDAELTDGTMIQGESKIQYKEAPIHRVRLSPENPAAYLPAVTAILNADLIVLGPGSLYTSIVPNLLVPDIVRAVRASSAPKVYVMNVATQTGETDRFTQASSELDGHSFGNLFITALTKVTGSFERAVIESANVLNIRGRVLPSTLENVRLDAELTDGTMIQGESKIQYKEAPIRHVRLSPGDPAAYRPAVTAILNADLIVLGPGSLYTSIVPNLLVPDIVRAVRASSAPKVYVMNVATQKGETDHFTALDHLVVVDEQLGPGELDAVLINSNMASAEAIGPDLPIEPLLPDSWDRVDPSIRVIARDVVSEQNPLRHDPEKLATALFDLTNGRWREETQASDIERGKDIVSARRRDLVAAGGTRE
ncbi:MAG TPA: uridine diphosphate-N-acetylglucosamine-binding protein YvcK, partial [Thermomicrobiales bacterium]|nr:uridine diphosphate-N-acetylglucosamine-binding protein YvcK [Thermomicrobiales bacterium]